MVFLTPCSGTHGNCSCVALAPASMQSCFVTTPVTLLRLCSLRCALHSTCPSSQKYEIPYGQLLIIKASVVVHNEKPAPDFPKSLPQGKLGQIRTMMANRPNQQGGKRQKRRIDSCQTFWLFHADHHHSPH